MSKKKKEAKVASILEKTPEELIDKIKIPDETHINLDMTRKADYNIIVQDGKYYARYVMEEELLAFVLMVTSDAMKNMITEYRNTPEDIREKKYAKRKGRHPKADILLAESFLKNILNPTLADLVGKIYYSEKEKEMKRAEAPSLNAKSISRKDKR